MADANNDDLETCESVANDPDVAGPSDKIPEDDNNNNNDNSDNGLSDNENDDASRAERDLEKFAYDEERTSPPESSCKMYYQPDGTIYVVESSDHVTVERHLSYVTVLLNEPDQSAPNPSTLCYIKYTPNFGDQDGSAASTSAVYTYKIEDTVRESRDQSSPEECPTNEPDQLLLCLVCKSPVRFASRDSFVDHCRSTHDTSPLLESNCAILRNAGNGPAVVLAYLSPIIAGGESSESGFSLPAGSDGVTSSSEMATSLLLASKLSASRLLQLHSNAAASLPGNRLNATTTSTDDNDGDDEEASRSPSAPNTVVMTRCHLHPEGKTTGVECPKCDLVLGSSRSLGGHMTMMHSRNSCKTLKCPKCNWHYKYQETLEIHMSEKHNETPTSCAYCISNLPHPRLGRGEQWGCGYKPYRCDICKYSTLTKGNLSIHMQSDKHLNNVQEVQQGKLAASMAAAGGDAAAVAAAAAAALLQSAAGILPHVTSAPSGVVTSHSAANLIGMMAAAGGSSGECRQNSASSPPKPTARPTFRCDVCDYETTVARNLRIHNTSEKHAQNALIWQQSAKNFQQQPPSGKSFQMQKASGAGRHASMSDVAFGSASTASSQHHSMASNASLMTLTTPTCPDDAITSSFALSFQNLMFETALLTDAKLLQCCVCLTFTCDNATDLMSHCQNADRSRQNDTDVSLVAGNYVCNLCHYKTPLKANFHLHIKTDKHMQRLQLVNHVREGGMQNEFRAKYLNPNNPIQLRCVPCNEFVNSLNKLQSHFATSRHKSLAASFDKIRHTTNLPANSCFYCTLCDCSTSEKRHMLTHLHSDRHVDLLNQYLPVIENSDGVDSNMLSWIEIRDKEDEAVSEEFEENEDNNDEETDECFVQRQTAPMMTDDKTRLHCSEENLEIDKKYFKEELQLQNRSTHFMCPLCQTDCGSNRENLECHLTQMHSVPSEGVQRLLTLMPTTSSLLTPSASSSMEKPSGNNNNNNVQSPLSKTTSSHLPSSVCPVCNKQFDDLNSLFRHQQENVDHVETKETPSGSSLFLCWSNECKENFDTLHSVQEHFRNVHFNITNGGSGVNKCYICGKLFKSLQALNKHVDVKHNNTLSHTVELLQLRAKLVEQNKGPFKLNGNNVDQHDVASSTATADGNSVDELLNTLHMAELHYNDTNRSYKCDRCRVAFTKEIYLTLHNRTIQHCQHSKLCSSNNNFDGGVSSLTSSTNKARASISPTALPSPVNIEKYNDPKRPHRCEVCMESFTTNTILLAHCNSVSHLNKLKKVSKERGQFPFSNGVSSSSRNSPLSVVNQRKNSSTQQSPAVDDGCKKFKCNICKVGYGSNGNLESHLRSVGHQSKQSRLCELVLNGEVDISKPLVEHPDLIEKSKHQQKSTDFNKNQLQFLSALGGTSAMGNPLLNFPNMALCDDIWQNLYQSAMTGGQGLPFATAMEEQVQHKQQKTTLSTPPSPQPEQNFKFKTCPKTGVVFRKMLENYGFEVVMQYNEGRHKKRPKSVTSASEGINDSDESDPKRLKIVESPCEDDVPTTLNNENENIAVDSHQVMQSVPEMTKCKCTFCCKEFSSVWVLKAHVEQVHKQFIPVDEVEKMSEEFKHVYDKKFSIDQATESNDLGGQQNRQNLSNASSSTDTGHHAIVNKVQHQSTTPAVSVALSQQQPNTSTMNPQMAAMAAMSMGLMPFPFMGMQFSPFGMPFMPMMMPPSFESLPFNVSSSPSVSSSTPVGHMTSASGAKVSFSTAVSSSTPMPSISQQMSSAAMMAQQQQQQPKRARTRITDDQLKVLREYFDINNSPSEEQIEQMSNKSGLPQKVIKHWFRNTLFKERQRSKDSPYNFNIPPQLGIDLEEYEKTGETKIIPYLNPNIVAMDESATASISNNANAVAVTKVEEKPVVVPKLSISVDSIVVKQEVHEEPTTKPSASKSSKSNYQDRATKCDIVANEFAYNDDEFQNEYGANSVDLSVNNETNCFNNAAALNAQETFRQLAAIGLTPLHFSAFAAPPGSNEVSPLTSLLSQHASMQNHHASGGSTSDLTNMIASALSPNNQLGAGAAGRRANRTRFSEWQVKTLQEFFEKNAYPKDDDLEVLSGKLNLSPRVIVVWFQNARQKARKIYENLPAECEDRFVRTPGLNYQCKKCRLVFQRYYELIKHQKSACFKDETKFDGDQSPPPSRPGPSNSAKSGGSFSSGGYHHHHHKAAGGSLSNSQKGSHSDCGNSSMLCDICGFRVANLVKLQEHMQENHMFNNELERKLSFSDMEGSSEGNDDEHSLESTTKNGTNNKSMMLADQMQILRRFQRENANPSPATVEQLASDIGLPRKTVESYFENIKCKNAVSGANKNRSSIQTTSASSARVFNKRCPFCGILFHDKCSMDAHLNTKHVAQCLKLGHQVDVDALPNAEEVPIITTVPLNSLSGAVAPNLDLGDYVGSDASTPVGKFDDDANNATGPLDLSRSLKQNASLKNQLGDFLDEFAAAGGNNAHSYSNSVQNNNRTPSNNSNDEEMSFMSYDEHDDERSFYSQSPSSHSPQHQQQQLLAALTRPQKRFRTRLTPQQIRIMKYLFNDFKTPSMSECEILGNTMSLHKRVVQVWFQNARAKEKKAKPSTGNSFTESPDGGGSSSSGNNKPTPAKCTLCDIPYTGRMNMQDHSFSKCHIDRIRKLVEQTENENPSSASSSAEFVTEKQHHHAVGNNSSSSLNLMKQCVSNNFAPAGENAATSGSRSSGGGGGGRNSSKNLHGQPPQQHSGQHHGNGGSSREVKKSPSVAPTDLSASVNLPNVPSNFLPYVYAAAMNPYASMMPTGFSAPFSNGVFDPNVHGTPLYLLQIPTNVMQLIAEAMQNVKESRCRFTQDGKTVADLIKLLEPRDRSCVKETDKEVGWACRSCNAVFQAEAQFLTHQHFVCQSKDRAFVLIQTHYECKLCTRPVDNNVYENQYFGTQAEFISHCETSEHRSKQKA